MSKFRKKPVVIDAWCWRIRPDLDKPQWLTDALASGVIVALNEYAGSGAEINTLEGTMRADLGDWIIRGVKGELYPCKPDIFAATYEPVE